MGPVTAQMVDVLGYDPDDRTPDIRDLAVLPPETVVRAVARLRSGRLVVVDDRCPHDGGRISDGWVAGEHLVCARHGWELTVENGHCVRACKPRE